MKQSPTNSQSRTMQPKLAHSDAERNKYLFKKKKKKTFIFGCPGVLLLLWLFSSCVSDSYVLVMAHGLILVVSLL